MKKQKILQLCYRPNTTVSQFDLFEEAVKSFDSEHYEVHFAFMLGEPDQGLISRMDGIAEVHYFQFHKKQVRGIGLSVLNQLKAFINDYQIDVIITHRYKPSYYLFLLSPFLKNVKRIVAVYHGLHQFNRLSRRLLAKLCTDQRWRFVAVSSVVADDLKQAGLPKQQVVTIANAIDVKAMQAQQMDGNSAREALGIDRDRTVIGTTGQTRTVKGHRYLIEGFAPLALKNDKLHLLIIGGGPLQQELEKLCLTLAIDQQVTITGILPNAYRYTRAIDLFIMTSLYEGLPIAILEAMAAERPVAATAVGGIPEALGKEGVLFGSKSSIAVQTTLEQWLRLQPEDQQAYATMLYHRLQSLFSIDRYHNDYRNIIGEA
jgi:glycosyltransferase involved in cell wall biosynthesis